MKNNLLNRLLVNAEAHPIRLNIPKNNDVEKIDESIHFVL